VFLEEELTELVRELLEICAEREECSLQLRSGEDGTERSISTRRDTLWSLLLPLLVFPLWLWPEDTLWMRFPRFPWLWTTRLLTTLISHQRLLLFLSLSMLMPMLKKSKNQKPLELAKEKPETEDSAKDVDLWLFTTKKTAPASTPSETCPVLKSAMSTD